MCYDTLAMTKYNDEKLAWMMLLDGCFILQFIHSSAREEDMSNLLRNHEISLVELDLFLLENQIPFGILRLIFEGAQFKDGSRMKYMINRFVADTNGILSAGYGRGLPQLPEESSHLLHLMRIALLGGKDKIPRKNPKQLRFTRQFFQHFMELRAAGISLRPSNRGFLTDISLESNFFRGSLKLPQITIDEFTHTRCLNILTYEISSEGPDDYAVTSYICFLGSLIDDADDAKELRSRHILCNFLGSDEEVARIFLEIINNLVHPAIFQEIEVLIQKTEYLYELCPLLPLQCSREYDSFHCCSFDAVFARIFC